MKKSKTILNVALLLLWVGPAHALRIVSLLPSNTEILESLGAGGEVVGASRFDKMLVRHPDVANIGDFTTPNMEKIVSLKPDLVVAGLWSSSHIVPRLSKLGYRVLEIRNPRSLDEIYQSIHVLAKAVGRPDAAGPVIKNMRERLEAVRQRAGRFPHRLKMYIEIDRPYWTVGGQDYMNEAMALAGADNVFSDLKRPAAQVSPEVIVERNPELIISFVAKRPEIAARAGWGSIHAVRVGAIIDDLPEDFIARPSPALAAGLEALVQRLETLGKL